MTDVSPESMVNRSRGPIVDGRPIRKDEIELAERGIYVESWLPERRSRRKPLLFVHGELTGSWLWERYLGYFAGRGWEGHALNLRNHFWSQSAAPAELSFDSYLEDVAAVMGRIGPNVVVVGHGMGGLLAMKAAERMPAAALVLVSAEPPRDLRPAARMHELRDIPELFGKAIIGWETLPEKLQRDHRDLSLPDGVPVDRGAIEGIPKLVIGAGLDAYVRESTSSELAGWLGAQYEPFGAHSHFGLVLAEAGYQQVAEVIRAFLETHRL